MYDKLIALIVLVFIESFHLFVSANAYSCANDVAFFATNTNLADSLAVFLSSGHHLFDEHEDDAGTDFNIEQIIHCDRKCQQQQPSIEKISGKWAAVISSTETLFSQHTAIYNQVQNAILLGASAVILFAFSADYFGQHVTFYYTCCCIRTDFTFFLYIQPIWQLAPFAQPIYLISKNVSKLFKFFVGGDVTNLTIVSTRCRLRPNMSKKVEISDIASLSMWVACEKVFSPTDGIKVVYGTVCTNGSTRDKNREEDYWLNFIAMCLAALFLFWMKSTHSNGAELEDWIVFQTRAS